MQSCCRYYGIDLQPASPPNVGFQYPFDAARLTAGPGSAGFFGLRSLALGYAKFAANQTITNGVVTVQGSLNGVPIPSCSYSLGLWINQPPQVPARLAAT
jgi:hypothetical protein